MTRGMLGLEGAKGQLFDFDALSKMTKEDLPKALEIMSKMYIEGKLSTQVMQKMFTARHFMEISNLLIDINGNTDEFVNRIAKGVDYSNDFYKKMFDINQQVKMLGNNFKNSTKGFGAIATKSITGSIMGLNSILQKTPEGLSEVVGGLTSVTTTIAGVTFAFGGLMKFIVPIFASGGVIGLALGALTVGAGLIGKKYYEAQKHVADLNINLNQSVLINKRVEQQLKTNENIQKTMNKLYVDAVASQKNGVYNLEESTTLMSQFLAQNKEFSNLMEVVGKYKSIDETFLPSSTNTVQIKALRESILFESAQIEAGLMSGLDGFKKITSEKIDYINKEMELGVISSRVHTKQTNRFEKELKDAELIYNTWVEIGKTETNIEERKKKLLEETSKRGVSENYVDFVMSKASLEDNATAMDGLNSKISEFTKLNEIAREEFKTFTQQLTDNSQALNMIYSQINKMKLEDFQETGKFKGVEGFAGFLELYKESSTSELDISRTVSLKGLDDVKGKLEDLNVLKLGGNELTEENIKYEKELLQTQDLLQAKLERAEALKKEGVSLDEESLLKLTQNIPVTKETLSLFASIVKIKAEIAEKKILNKEDLAISEALNKALDEYIKKIQKTGAEIESKKQVTSYQLKYGNYLKESLDLELESLKLGKSKAEQEFLTYTYKLKQYEVDKKISEEAIKVSQGDLRTGGAGAFEKYRKQALGVGTGAGSAKKLQAILDTIFKTEDKVRWGEPGSKEKAFTDSLKTAIQEQVKYEGILQNIDILPKKTINEFQLETLPSLNKSIVDMLQQSFDLTGISMKNPDKMNLENLKQELNDLIEQTSLQGLDALPLDELNQKILAQREVVLAKIKEAEIDSSYEKAEALKDEEKRLKNLLDIQSKRLGIAKQELDIELKKLSVYENMGSVLSSLGGKLNIQGLEDIGSIFTDLSKYTQTNLSKQFNFKDLFNMEAENFADNFANAMSNALDSINLGSSIGAMLGSITGGGASSQAGGTLGGLIGGLGGADALAGALGISTGGAGIAISAGMSLLGGLFGGKDNDQEEANKRTAEAKKIYDKNTEALNKLAQNMSNLSGGIDGLNSSLVSSFSKIPTFGKLTSVEGTLKDMFSTMEKTRKFNEVAYQVTKTKKGKSGFLGIGATAGSSWTETIEVSVQEMLNKYGFKGAIEDMTTQQLRDFSTWLEDYDIGDSDNFSILAGAIEDYAEALDQFDKNIEKFFYDTTMESFAGISSLQQDELRQQIEGFYKNLGFQIDESLSKEIDKIMEEMSVMVTVMQDVRGQFVKTWRDSGKDAGSAFLSSMNPYINAMLENLSQIFYDVYFSDVTDVLEKEFKTLSEQLVELKKQGADLDWDSVAGNLSGSFDKVLSAIISAKQETESFNDIILELQKQAMEAGLTLSEMLELGLVSGTQKDVLESFKSALLSSDSESAFASIGEMVGDKIGNALADKMLDNMMSDKILEFSANLDKIVSGNLSFDSLAGLASEAMSVGMMLDDQRRRLEAIKDLFNFNKDISYESQESNIEYSSGVSQNVTNIYNITSSVEAGNVIEADSLAELARRLLEEQLEILKVEKGIDITRNY